MILAATLVERDGLLQARGRRPVIRVSDKRIMGRAGHRSLPTVHRYAREAELFKNNPAASLGDCIQESRLRE